LACFFGAYVKIVDMPKVKSTFTLLRLVFNLFKPEHQQIFYPYIIIVFINLLVLETLYFAPRHPLSSFFYPLIGRIWGAEYLHYPMDLMLLPKLFYYTQVIIFLFVSSFLTAIIADMVAAINNEKQVNFGASFQKSLPRYIYIFLYSLLSLLLLESFDYAYGLLIQRVHQIHSTTGIYFCLKKLVFFAHPYAQFLYENIATALLIYVPVLVILEKKKFIGALIDNFKTICGSFWLTLTLVLVPTLGYLPLLLMKNNIGNLVEMTSPEVQVVALILNIFVTTGINIFIMASASAYYLYKKENL